MKVTYGIREVTRYQIFREHSGENGSGVETFAEPHSLEMAERMARLFSEAEPGSTWYTVPQRE